jgi:hypothetical protein
MTWKNELPLIASAGVIEVKFDLETSAKIRQAADKAGRNVADCVVAMVNFALKYDERVTGDNLQYLREQLTRERLRGVREVGVKEKSDEYNPGSKFGLKGIDPSFDPVNEAKQELGNFSSSTPR